MTASKQRSKRSANVISGGKAPEELRVLSNRMMRCACRGLPTTEFIREISKMVSNFLGCDQVALRFREGNKQWHGVLGPGPKRCFHVETESLSEDSAILVTSISVRPRRTVRGNPLRLDPPATSRQRKDCASLAQVVLAVGGKKLGFLEIKRMRKNSISKKDVALLQVIAPAVAIGIMTQGAQAALHERVKELTCLYRITQLADDPDKSLDHFLRRVLETLPAAWQFPGIAAAMIVMDGRRHASADFRRALQIQSAEIITNGKKRGLVEVAYTKNKPRLDEGPFLKEERYLLDSVAKQVALILERREAEADRAKFQEQLRHADRLATIGQLAAGVAHELNEPLGNILGFAQLSLQCLGAPEQVQRDLEKIVGASLCAREVIKKLMLFARQTPTAKRLVDLNQLIAEGLSLLYSRCVKEGIEVERLLDPNLPRISADPGQMIQVLVNLVVNSIQAMPRGGKLTVRTFPGDGQAFLVVEDTGVGMSNDVLNQIFVPFFTTKDIHQGTGLGLPVVEGIVVSHGGEIRVESKVGKGTRFEIGLPLDGPHKQKEPERHAKI